MTSQLRQNGARPSAGPLSSTGALAELGRLLAAEELDAAAARTALLGGVLQALPVMRWASLTTAVHSQPVTLAASADAAEAVDALQYRAGAGPCLQALTEAGTVRADDLAAENRWDQLVAAVLATTPVRAVVSCSLAGAGHPQISLNLYAAEPLADRPDASDLATAAALCAVGLTAIDQRHRADHLERALATGRRIGAAMGILMASKRMTDQQAFDALRTASQHSHRKLRDVAEDVLLTGELPHVPPPRYGARPSGGAGPAGASRPSGGAGPGGGAGPAGAGRPARPAPSVRLDVRPNGH